jgi:hypothetical protein
VWLLQVTVTHPAAAVHAAAAVAAAAVAVGGWHGLLQHLRHPLCR